MRIFGKALPEYIAFEKVFLILVLIVGLGRLGLSLADVPNSTTKYLSLTVLMLIGFLFYSVWVYISGFGSFKQLYPVLLLQAITSESIIILGIVLAMITGKDNIFSAPEFSGGRDGKSLIHVGGHLVFGMILFPLVLWGLGSLIMLIVKKISPRPATA